MLSAKVIGNNPALYGDGSITLAKAYEKMGSFVNKSASFAAEARAIASPKVPAVPPIAVAPPMPAAPQVTRLNTPAAAPPPAAPMALPGQDVPDRTIAHIATGGVGGGLAHRWT